MNRTEPLFTHEQPDSSGKKRRWWLIIALTLAAILAIASYLIVRKPWETKAQHDSLISAPTLKDETKRMTNQQDQQPVQVPADAFKPLPAAQVVPTQQQETSATYTAIPGDTLIGRFGEKDAYAVCKLNKLKNCDVIFVKQVLKLPEGVVPNTKPVMPVVVPMNAAGEILYTVIGRAPLNGCGKKDVATVNEEAWTMLGLSEEDKAYLRTRVAANGPRKNITAEEGLVFIGNDTRLGAVTFCRNGQVVVKGPMRTNWGGTNSAPAERFKLPSGRVLDWMWECFNWVEGTSAPPEMTDTPRVDPPATPEVPSAPSAPPAEQPTTPATPAPVTEAPKGFCDVIDPTLVAGQEHEFPQDGNRADSTFVTAGLHCLRPGKGGIHGYGVKLQASSWSGSVNQGAGQYKGSFALVGPSYKWIDDDGWDMEVSAPLLGKYRDEFRQGLYRSERKFGMVGVAAGANFYQRRLEGKTTNTETQVFGVLGVPTSRSASHSWDGQAIADTSDLTRFGLIANLGVRQWLWEPGWASFYGQAGYFLQTPSSESASLRAGVADPNRIAGIGIGHNFDLKNGGDPREAWSWWVDVPKGFDVARASYRSAQVREEMREEGVYVDPATRAIKFRNPEKFIGNEIPQQ